MKRISGHVRYRAKEARSAQSVICCIALKHGVKYGRKKEIPMQRILCIKKIEDRVLGSDLHSGG